jgi:hypothetical protein
MTRDIVGTMRPGRSLLYASVVIALSACSSSKPPPPSGAAPSGAGTSNQPSAATSSASASSGYDPQKACSLLSPADIKSTIDADVSAGAIGDQQPGLWVECRYYRGTDLMVRVQVATPANAQSAYEGNCQATDPATVPGSDKACWDSGLNSVNVLKGGVEFDVVYADSTAKSDQAKTTALAVAALANLPKLG